MKWSYWKKLKWHILTSIGFSFCERCGAVTDIEHMTVHDERCQIAKLLSEKER